MTLEIVFLRGGKGGVKLKGTIGIERDDDDEDYL